MAVVIVIGLLSITLALSYSMLRTQVTCVQIQSNSVRRSSAQMAAIAGVQATLHAMSQPDWAGVGVPVVGNVSDTDSYSVTVETGDPSLDPSHPEYDEYPYRVTLISTGSAQDPVNPSQESIHQLHVVVQLVRRKLADPPSGSSQVLPYTVYQWSHHQVEYELPARIEGPCYLQGRLRLCHHYPDADAKSQYLGDLEQMRASGLPDHRPFDGPLYLPYSRNPDLSLLANELNLPVNNVSAGNSPPFSHPGHISHYRLYPGGQEYQAQRLSWLLRDETLERDALVNPLGLYTRHGGLLVGRNVTVRGTLVTWGGHIGTDISMGGNNITFEAVQLPPLAGDSSTYQLPAIAAGDDIRVYSHTHASISGAVYARDDYEITSNHGNVQIHLQGKLVCGDLEIQRKWSWHRLNWRRAMDDFEDQNSIAYLPQWIEEHKGLASDPLVTIQPDSNGVVHHWPDWSQPIFVPHPDDGGLRWEVIEWKDGT